MNPKYDLSVVDVNKSMSDELLSAGWNFDWSIDRDKPSDPDIEYYKVGAFVGDELEGLIKYTRRSEELFNFVHLIELAPYNIGRDKTYDGVAGALFAYVALDSLEQGFDGFIVFESKSVLYNHYMLKYGAKPTLGKLLMFDKQTSIKLINDYLGEEIAS